MKNSNKIKLVAMAVFISLANCMCGCSVVGLGVGAAIDNKQPEYRKMETHQFQSIEPGKEIVLHLEDGSLRSGKYSDNHNRRHENTAIFYKDTALTLGEQMLIIQPRYVSDSVQQNETVSLSSISFMEIKNKKEAKHLGLMAGLIIDIALVYWLSSIDLYLPL
jgi:hypothetical protein